MLILFPLRLVLSWMLRFSVMLLYSCSIILYIFDSIR